MEFKTPEPIDSAAFDVQQLQQLIRPCVYRFVEISTGRALYIGSSSQGIARVLVRHKHVPRLDHALHRVVVEWMSTPAAAEIREADLIWELRPPWNVAVCTPLVARVRVEDAERRRRRRAARRRP
jgi:hypothetical protein